MGHVWSRAALTLIFVSSLAGPQLSAESYRVRAIANSSISAPMDLGWPTRQGIAAVGSGLALSGFAYSGFSSAAGISLVEDASLTGGVLRLNPSEPYATGAAWHTAPQYVAGVFTTTFAFRVLDLGRGGADGFAFVIQHEGPAALGGGGGLLGYSYLRPSLAIEFDTNANQEIGDADGNHVSAQTRGIEPNDGAQYYSIGSATAPVNLKDGAIHTVTISYWPGLLRVWFSGNPIATVTATIDLSTALDLGDGRAWVGFTAATGAMWETHDLLSWSFDVSGDTGAAPLAHREEMATDMNAHPDGAAKMDLRKALRIRPSIPVPVRAEPPLRLPPGESPQESDARGADGLLDTDGMAPARSDVYTWTVTTSADAGPGSLRDALAGALAGDVIRFDVGVFAPQTPMTILLSSALPELTTGLVTIDASGAGVVLDGRLLSNANGLTIKSSGNVVRGLQIFRMPWNGIQIESGASENVIGGDFTVGNAPHGQGNIISNNGGSGILVSGGNRNTIAGNLIGLDANGTRDVRFQTIVASTAFGTDRTLFAGTRYQGVMRSVNGGATWTEINAGLVVSSVEAIALSPGFVSDSTVFAGGMLGDIYRSVNRGTTWARVDDGTLPKKPITMLGVSSGYASDHTVIAFIKGEGIFISIDFGATWASRNAGMAAPWNTRAAAVSPFFGADKTIFVANWDLVERSTDGGQTWQTVVSGAQSLRALGISPSYASDGTVFAGIDACPQTPGVSLLKTTNFGATWTPVTTTQVVCGLRALALSPVYSADQTLFLGDQWNGIFRSQNGGATWSNTQPTKFVRALAFSPAYASDHRVFAGVGQGAVFTTSNSGQAWSLAPAGLSEAGNGLDGVRITDGAAYNLVGGVTQSRRNVISHNGEHGVLILLGATRGNTVTGNYIGIDATGVAPLGNGTEGILVTGPENRIGGDNPGERNVVSANALTGIAVWEPQAVSNTIRGNFVGVDSSGARGLGNGENGVVIAGQARGASISGNTVAANGGQGIGLFEASTGNVITANRIGVDASGSIGLGNYYNGIVVANGSSGNVIGGASPVNRNVIGANLERGIAIWDAGTVSNSITGNYIGVDASGTTSLGNRLGGVIIGAGASGNRVGGNSTGERNVIAGNGSFGVGVFDAGTDANVVTGNYIGVDASGAYTLPNAEGVSAGGGASGTRIGGSGNGEGNLISGNSLAGVVVWGTGTTDTLIAGNNVGVNASGLAPLGNAGTGVVVDGAKSTRVGGSQPGERNIISANAAHGLGIWGVGTDRTVVMGNYIGLDASGSNPLGNNGGGVSMENGASYSRIGGSTAAERNVIADSLWDGVSAYGANTLSNTITGNYIGVDATGLKALPNRSSGVALQAGTRYNRVGGTDPGEANLLSGNEDGGIAILNSGTRDNVIIGNLIGVDATLYRPLANRYGLTCRGNASNNSVIGNLISGNYRDGVKLDGCDAFGFSGNFIGLSADGRVALGNGESGLNLHDGAVDNVIGPGNVIANNAADGVQIADATTARNRVTQNAIRGNLGAGIRLVAGGNGALPAPALEAASADTAVGSGAPAGAIVEVYSSHDGEGWLYEATGAAAGDGSFVLSDLSRFNGSRITALVTAPDGTTSAFSNAVAVPLPACLAPPAYLGLVDQAWAEYPSSTYSRTLRLIQLLDSAWNQTAGAIGAGWSASPTATRTLDLGYRAIGWMDFGGVPPQAGPAGGWVPEPGVTMSQWGVFRMWGAMSVQNSGRFARLCGEEPTVMPVTVALAGPVAGTASSASVFVAIVDPITATVPITWIWEATGHSPVTSTGLTTARHAFVWTSVGQKLVTVTALSPLNAVTSTRSIPVAASPIYARTGLAISAPTSPPPGSGWGLITLTASIPAGASAKVTLLDGAQHPLADWTNRPLTDGVNILAAGAIDINEVATLRLRVDLLTSDPMALPQMLSVEFGWSPDPGQAGDQYEPDNSCQAASNIIPDGRIQRRTFNPAGDEDWVQFNAISGTTYILEAYLRRVSAMNIAATPWASCPGVPGTEEDRHYTKGVRIKINAASTGPQYVRLRNTGAHEGRGSDYLLSVRPKARSAPGGAVIIVGGRESPSDSLNGNIKAVTKNFYNAMTARGYVDDRIKFLSTDATVPGYDGTPTLANLQQAITVWAPQWMQGDEPLTIYMIDHGVSNAFYLDYPFEVLTPSTLNGWLDQLQAARPGARVNVIIEACYSGSFIKAPGSISGMGRVIVTSADDASAAAASQAGAWFSDRFISSLKEGRSLYMAYLDGIEGAQAQYATQIPQLDDNGDQSSDGSDGEEAQRRAFTYNTLLGATENWPPLVLATGVMPTAISGTQRITASVVDDLGVSFVFATIFPPGYQPPAAGSALVTQSLRTLSLNAVGGSDFAVDDPGFAAPGRYRLVVWAVDGELAASAPEEVFVDVGTRVFLPRIER